MFLVCPLSVNPAPLLWRDPDSDLQPAIKEVRERGNSVVYLGFESQPNKGITYTTNRTILIRNAEVLEFEKMPTLFGNDDETQNTEKAA